MLSDNLDRRPGRLGRLSALGLFTVGFGLTVGCGDDDDDAGSGGSAGSASSSAGSAGMAGAGGAGMAGSAGSAGAAGSMGMAGGAGMSALGAAATMGDASQTAGGPTANGLEIPGSVFDWPVMGMVDRGDDGSGIRLIVGNPTAMQAARAGLTNPWPDGSMLAHYVWSDVGVDGTDDVVPGDFRALTLMVKDGTAYADDGGWAYGIWTGPDLQPNQDPGFDRACVNCHVDNAPSNDFVFTRVAALPSLNTVGAATATPNGLDLPAGILDWRVVGAVNRDNGTLRAIVGNDVAVDAARSGQTAPWPNGSMLAHFVWADSTNPLFDDGMFDGVSGSVVPGAFRNITLMVRDDAAYAADGNWAYGNWVGANLLPPDAGFDQACIDCHVENASDTDYVFTRPGPLGSLD